MQPSTESSIKSVIQMEVAQVIRNECQCDFQERFISQAVILCDQQQPTQIVYRASITSYRSYCSDQLVGYVEDWVKQGATFTSGGLTVTFDPNCPVRIDDISDPVCTGAAIPTSTSVVTPTSTLSTLNIPAVIASVSVVVVIFAATITVIVILIFYLFNRKKQL